MAGIHIERLPPEEAEQLVQEGWAPHEARMYKNTKITPGSPPKWDTQLLSYPDLGPSDTSHAQSNKNRPANALNRDPESDLKAINDQLQEDEFRLFPCEGDGWTLPTDAPVPLQELFIRSEMRTPLIIPASLLGLQAHEVVKTIQSMGTDRVKAVTIVDLTGMDGAAAADACDREIKDALNAGKWLVINHPTIRKPHAQGDPACGELDLFPAYRALALAMMTAKPDGVSSAELFRLWVVTPEVCDLDNTNFPTFPTLFVQNALQLKPSEQSGRASPTKIVKKLPADPQLLENEVAHREKRRAAGKEVDAESLKFEQEVEGKTIDDQCNARKITGPIFVRSREMHEHTSPQRSRQRYGFSQELGSTAAE